MEGDDSASLADEHYAIVRDGQTIGYVVQVEYLIDHPLFAGGGIHLYYNAAGQLLAEVEWWG